MPDGTKKSINLSATCLREENKKKERKKIWEGEIKVNKRKCCYILKMEAG